MFIDLASAENGEVREMLERRLARRNLVPVIERWEVHGPHYPDMPYSVYIGVTEELQSHEPGPYVAVYPKAIYDIGFGEWWNTQEAVRLHVEK